MMTPVERIRASPAYLNIVRIFGDVFGVDNWRVNSIWPDGNADDFYMAVDIDGATKAAYISVGDTHSTGMYSRGHGGGICVCVPVVTDSRLVFPDDVGGDTVDRLVGTVEEHGKFRWGADGLDKEDIEQLVRILKRYLDQRDEPMPPNRSVK